MEKQMQTFTDDELAVNEPPVPARQILAEIVPLLVDYFQGEVIFDGNSVAYRMPNGQRFKLSAEETA